MGPDGFDDSNWQAAQVVNGPGGELKGLSCAAPPIRAFEIHQPFRSRTLDEWRHVFDLGQNAAHVPQISVTGPAGSRVRVIPAELNANGSVDPGLDGRARRSAIWCEYTKARTARKRGRPNFSTRLPLSRRWKSFPGDRGRTQLPAVKSIAGVVVHSASAPVGEFECSNPLFNRIRTLVRWAQRNNMMSVMTDCPHREKLGWLEEDHLERPGAAL